MTVAELLAIGQPYGLKGISFGGCIGGKAKGFKGAMRRSAHAHWYKKSYIDWYKKHDPEGLKWLGWVCVKSGKLEKLVTSSGRPSQLFWHEVGHLYHSSWTQGQCDDFGWKMVKNYR